MNKGSGRGLAVAVASLALAAGLAGSCGQKPAPAAALKEAPEAGAAMSARIARVEVRELSDEVISTGRLVVREEAAVGSEIPGYVVADVLADEGDWVRKGQPLARLDDTLLRAQIAQVEASLAQQEAVAAFRESQARRADELAASGAFSVELVEQRRMEAMSARAAVTASKAQVDEMKTRQSRMILRAPVTGRVLQRNIRPGEISGAGAASPYFRIARDGLIELDAEAPDSRLASLKVGERAVVTLASGLSIEGKIRFISPRIEQATGLGKARIELPFDEGLRPGGFAEATFSGVRRTALSVPASAVRYQSGGPSLLMLDDANRVTGVPVRLGERFGDYIEILEGPPAGSRILATGTAFVLDGDVVRPVEAAASPAELQQ
jgi:HlyD family secretion protein